MKDLKKYTFKTLAIFLSILMIVYLVPTFVFAEWIDGLSSGTSGENDEPAGRASDTYEMTERREENVKHFHCPDGTNIAVQYDMPVHYLFYPQLGVKLCSMAGGGVQKSIWCF